MSRPATDRAGPGHVAVIMDGNGRWAEQRGLSRIEGHREGAESVRAVLRAARETGVRYLTLYAFSVENWSRPGAEVKALMNLLRVFLKRQEHELHENEVRLRAMGRVGDLPAAARRVLEGVIERTASYSRQLILALSYGGRAEIADAARRIAEEAARGETKPRDVDEKFFGRRMYLPDVPDPDLVIRTSGEMRMSNFLLWQASYAELYFTDTLWPDFREEHFRKAIEEYGRRKRRFGNVG